MITKKDKLKIDSVIKEIIYDELEVAKDFQDYWSESDEREIRKFTKEEIISYIEEIW